MLRCDSSQWPLLFRIPPHSVGSFSRAESIRSWCWSSASACFALISPFILWYAGMQIFEMTIFDDFSLFYVLSLKIIRSGSHHHLFGFFFHREYLGRQLQSTDQQQAPAVAARSWTISSAPSSLCVHVDDRARRAHCFFFFYHFNIWRVFIFSVCNNLKMKRSSVPTPRYLI